MFNQILAFVITNVELCKPLESDLFPRHCTKNRAHALENSQPKTAEENGRLPRRRCTSGVCPDIGMQPLIVIPSRVVFRRRTGATRGQNAYGPHKTQASG